MIAKSDMVILLLSASLLAAGIVRWQANLANLSRPAAIVTAPKLIQPDQSSQLTASPAIQQNAPTTRSVSANTQFGATGGNNTVGTTNATGNTQQTGLSGAAAPLVTTANQTQQATAVNEPLYGAYIVVYGDYLSKIANNFGTTVETLQRINNISGSRIDVDQQILYPLPAN